MAALLEALIALLTAIIEAILALLPPIGEAVAPLAFAFVEFVGWFVLLIVELFRALFALRRPRMVPKPVMSESRARIEKRKRARKNRQSEAARRLTRP